MIDAVTHLRPYLDMNDMVFQRMNAVKPLVCLTFVGMVAELNK